MITGEVLMIKDFNEFIERAISRGCRSLAVASAGDREVLKAVKIEGV